jgi:predicted Fe-S protein YdhL (DUF1289 family)
MYVTPCVSLCKLEAGICIGCKRTKEEITRWKSYTDDERLAVMKRLGYGKRKGVQR